MYAKHRQTNKQIYTQKDRYTNRKTDRHTDKGTDSHADWQSDVQTDIHTAINTDIHLYRQTHTWRTDMNIYRQIYIQSYIHTYRLGWVDFGHFYLRPKLEPALDLFKYNTPLDDLKFISSIKNCWWSNIQLYSYFFRLNINF